MKKIIPHLIAFAAIALFSIIYFAPAVFDGKVLQQTDSLQGIAAGKEVMEYSKKENREILWSNSMFSGMPTASPISLFLRPNKSCYLTLFRK